MATSPLIWQPRLGAIFAGGGTTFRVWAQTRRRVELLLNPGGTPVRRRLLQRGDDGVFAATFADVEPGDLYAYRLDGEGPFPDPASRFQPAGVHGPSAVVDPSTFTWSDDAWQGIALPDAVFYELHVGTFSPQGTFEGAAERLPYLADLGVTVVELMPVAEFPGSRNWGYDGVSLFAPSRAYGTPDDLRRLVDRAHALGLAVVLDVVYNHFGPDGAYVGTFSPSYLSARHRSPWGAAVNLDGEGATQVRAFFIENALHWLHEYHFDGLRLDATHGLIDDSPRHFVAELASRARASVSGRTILLVAEDERNLASIVRAEEEGGWELDAVWADDFHHQVRRRAAGDRDGYYEDYSGTIADIATTIRRGWFYCGQTSVHHGAPRGTDPSGVSRERMVVCIQNHDQVGNRPFGRRLNHQVEPCVFRALSALLLFLPETPLLFMGQEWAASSRFLFFTDHHPELGALVTEGRRAEFSRFEAFADPVTRTRIPDPQAWSTFADSRLKWEERALAPHAGTLELYRTLLRLRRTEAPLRETDRFDVVELDDACLGIRRGTRSGDSLLMIVCLAESRRVDLARMPGLVTNGWTIVLTTEDSRFRRDHESDSASEQAIEHHDQLVVAFRRPAALILTNRSSPGGWQQESA
jgi:maltooligosyltrehalose trehalohydrolase